jgi:hypothetical protein
MGPLISQEGRGSFVISAEEADCISSLRADRERIAFANSTRSSQDAVLVRLVPALSV